MVKKGAEKGKSAKPKAKAAAKISKSGKAAKAVVRQPVKKPVVKGKKKEKQAYTWIARKLEDSDPYFALDHAVSFLTDLFNQLISRNYATLAQVEEYIASTTSKVTLEQIFNHFGVRAGN